MLRVIYRVNIIFIDLIASVKKNFYIKYPENSIVKERLFYCIFLKNNRFGVILK